MSISEETDDVTNSFVPAFPDEVSLSIDKPHWEAVANRLFKYCVCMSMT